MCFRSPLAESSDHTLGTCHVSCSSVVGVKSWIAGEQGKHHIFKHGTTWSFNQISINCEAVNKQTWQKPRWSNSMGICSMVRAMLGRKVEFQSFHQLHWGSRLHQRICTPQGTEFGAMHCASKKLIQLQDSCRIPGATDIKRLLKAKVGDSVILQWIQQTRMCAECHVSGGAWTACKSGTSSSADLEVARATGVEGLSFHAELLMVFLISSAVLHMSSALWRMWNSSNKEETTRCGPADPWNCLIKPLFGGRVCAVAAGGEEGQHVRFPCWLRDLGSCRKSNCNFKEMLKTITRRQNSSWIPFL